MPYSTGSKWPIFSISYPLRRGNSDGSVGGSWNKSNGVSGWSDIRKCHKRWIDWLLDDSGNVGGVDGRSARPDITCYYVDAYTVIARCVMFI